MYSDITLKFCFRLNYQFQTTTKHVRKQQFITATFALPITVQQFYTFVKLTCRNGQKYGQTQK